MNGSVQKFTVFIIAIGDSRHAHASTTFAILQIKHPFFLQDTTINEFCVLRELPIPMSFL